MALLNEAKLRARAKQSAGINKTAAMVLMESFSKQEKATRFDIFLSHAFDDKELLAGALLTVEDLGYSVYLDWRDDPNLDRKQVTSKTASVLRERMKASRCLFFATTPLAKDSAWMKWELGFKDGQNSRAAILPITSDDTDAFAEQQFLGLYPYVSDGIDNATKKNSLWIHRSSSCYTSFGGWLDGKEPFEHP